MTPFTIFFLVVTFLYVIYYAVIITIDLNAKPKTDGSQAETLDMSGIIPNNDDDGNLDDEDIEESVSQPVSEEETPDDNPEVEDQQFEKTPVPPYEENNSFDDNPYGLKDDDDFGEGSSSESESDIESESQLGEGDTSDEDDPKENPHEPEVVLYDSEPENGGIAVDINNNNETINAESLTPCRPEMLASNVLDIVGVKRSFYGNQENESTLSHEMSVKNDEASAQSESTEESLDVMDRI